MVVGQRRCIDELHAVALPLPGTRRILRPPELAGTAGLHEVRSRRMPQQQDATEGLADRRPSRCAWPAVATTATPLRRPSRRIASSMAQRGVAVLVGPVAEAGVEVVDEEERGRLRMPRRRRAHRLQRVPAADWRGHRAAPPSIDCCCRSAALRPRRARCVRPLPGAPTTRRWPSSAGDHTATPCRCSSGSSTRPSSSAPGPHRRRRRPRRSSSTGASRIGRGSTHGRRARGATPALARCTSASVASIDAMADWKATGDSVADDRRCRALARRDGSSPPPSVPTTAMLSARCITRSETRIGAVRRDLLAHDAVRPLRGEHEVHAERAPARGDVGDDDAEVGEPLDHRLELVDDDDEAGELDVGAELGDVAGALGSASTHSRWRSSARRLSTARSASASSRSVTMPVDVGKAADRLERRAALEVDEEERDPLGRIGRGERGEPCEEEFALAAAGRAGDDRVRPAGDEVDLEHAAVKHADGDAEARARVGLGRRLHERVEIDARRQGRGTAESLPCGGRAHPGGATPWPRRPRGVRERPRSARRRRCAARPSLGRGPRRRGSCRARQGAARARRRPRSARRARHPMHRRRGHASDRRLRRARRRRRPGSRARRLRHGAAASSPTTRRRPRALRTRRLRAGTDGRVARRGRGRPLVRAEAGRRCRCRAPRMRAPARRRAAPRARAGRDHRRRRACRRRAGRSSRCPGRAPPIPARRRASRRRRFPPRGAGRAATAATRPRAPPDAGRAISTRTASSRSARSAAPRRRTRRAWRRPSSTDATATSGPSAANAREIAEPVIIHSTRAPPIGATVASRGNPARTGSGGCGGKVSGSPTMSGGMGSARSIAPSDHRGARGIRERHRAVVARSIRAAVEDESRRSAHQVTPR